MIKDGEAGNGGESVLHEVILRTKIRPPVPRGNGISRDRLTRRLTQALEGRVTIICAPAGFGKTTLLSQWARQVAAPVAWYSLDETDNDLVKFWRTLAHALAPFVSSSLPDRLASMLQAYPQVSIYAILDVLLYDLEEHSPEALAIVLDDYHAVEDASIHESLAYLIDHLPDRLHITLSSRTEPPIATARWNARGQRLNLSTTHLSFTSEEAGRFCRESAGLTLTEDNIEQLTRWTEGWAAGLQLTSLAIGERGDPERLIAHEPIGDRNVMQYLLDEIFGSLPPELKRFLLRTSVLSRFDASACDALADTRDGARTLEELQKRNLLLVPLDEKGAWFRYHHLFSLFLRNQLRLEAPELTPVLNRTAALHLSGRGLMDEAIEHAVAAQDGELAVRLLAEHVFAVLRRGELATLLRWMERMQAEELPAPLSLLQTYLQLVTGRLDQARGALDRLEKRAEALTGAASIEMQSGLFFLKVNLAFMTGDYEQWYVYAERLPELLPQSPLFFHVNYNTTEPFVRRTLFGLRGVQNAEIEAISLKILSILEAHGWGEAPFALYILQSMAEGYYEWNRLRDSMMLIRRIEPTARRERIAGLYVPNRITAARILWAQDEREAAYEVLEEAAEELRAFADSASWEGALRAAKAHLLIREGRLPEADKALDPLRLRPEQPSLFQTYEYTVLARQLGARRKEKEAVRLTDKLLRMRRREGCLAGSAEIAALQALVEAQRGYRSEAIGRLGEALAVGHPNGYVRTFLDEGEPMQSLLGQSRHNTAAAQQEPSTGEESGATALEAYTAALLEQFPRKKQSAARGAELPEPLTAKEYAVLLEAVGGAANREIAERLHLKETTVKVYLSRIYAKLGVASRIQALHRASELGLFEQT